MIYLSCSGTRYNLEDAPFAQGGEGMVFNIVGDNTKVAKLYKSGKATPIKEKKLLTMVKNPPDSRVMSQISWPLDVLYDQSRAFVGFVMPKLKINEDLNVMYEYGPSARYATLSWRNKITIAKNLCVVLDAVHSANHVVGDFNPKNISVSPDGRIVFVDTDSYHITEGANVYRCDVGMPEYIAPELQIKMKKGNYSYSTAPLPTFTEDTDNFALAEHIFQLLMNGAHPFACRVLPGQTSSVAYLQPVDNIIGGNFPYINPRKGSGIPIYAPPLGILTQEIQNLFYKAFVEGQANPKARPKAATWFDALDDMEKNLVNCPIMQTHQYHKSVASCPWCDAEIGRASCRERV